LAQAILAKAVEAGVGGYAQGKGDPCCYPNIVQRQSRHFQRSSGALCSILDDARVTFFIGSYSGLS